MNRYESAAETYEKLILQEVVQLIKRDLLISVFVELLEFLPKLLSDLILGPLLLDLCLSGIDI